MQASLLGMDAGIMKLHRWPHFTCPTPFLRKNATNFINLIFVYACSITFDSINEGDAKAF